MEFWLRLGLTWCILSIVLALALGQLFKRAGRDDDDDDPWWRNMP